MISVCQQCFDVCPSHPQPQQEWPLYCSSSTCPLLSPLVLFPSFRLRLFFAKRSFAVHLSATVATVHNHSGVKNQHAHAERKTEREQNPAGETRNKPARTGGLMPLMWKQQSKHAVSCQSVAWLPSLWWRVVAPLLRCPTPPLPSEGIARRGKGIWEWVQGGGRAWEHQVRRRGKDKGGSVEEDSIAIVVNPQCCCTVNVDTMARTNLVCCDEKPPLLPLDTAARSFPLHFRQKKRRYKVRCCWQGVGGEERGRVGVGAGQA